MRSRRPKILKGPWLTLLATILIALAYLVFSERPYLQALEHTSLDMRFELRGPRPVTDQVALILIDDASIRELGSWPLSRRLFGEAAVRLREAGVSLIAIDLLLEGESREVGAEKALAEAIRVNGRVLLPYAFVYADGEGEGQEAPESLAESAYRVVLEGGASQAAGPLPLGIITPAPRLMAEALSIGHVNIFPDPLGRLTSFQPALKHGDAYYPALVLEALRLHLGLPREQLVLQAGRSLELGDRFYELDPSGRLHVDFPDAGEGLPSYSLATLLRGEVPDGALSGKIVLIGVKAVGIGDSYSTPFTGSLAGVEFLGAVLDNLIGERFLERRPSLDVAMVVLMGLLASLLWLLKRPLAIFFSVLLLLVTWSAVAFLAFAQFGLWLNFIFPAAAIVCCGTIVFLGQALRNRAGALEGEMLRRFVTPLAAAQLERSGGGDREELRQLTLLFIDMVGFTRRSESMKPGDVMAMLRPYHRQIARIARVEGGLVESFSGDGALIVFGMKDGSLGGAGEAVACALRLAEAFVEEGKEDIRVGIGLHMGPVAVGPAGGEDAAEITVNGDPVNVASRLEGLTRTLKRTIIASDVVIEAAKAERGQELLAGFQFLEQQHIRGRERPLQVWGWPSN